MWIPAIWASRVPARFSSAAVIVLVFCTGAYLRAAESAEARALMSRVLEAENENRHRMVNYLFEERIIRKSFDRDRKLAAEQSSAFEVTFIEGKPAFRRISINGRPLTPEEERAELARLRQLGEDRRSNPGIPSPAEQRRRSHPLRVFFDLHEFAMSGSEVVDGRDCWVVTSKPAHPPREDNIDEQRIAHSTAKFWIDKQTLHRMRMDVSGKKPEGPAKIHEFTSYEWRQRDGEVWLVTAIRTVLPLHSGPIAYYEGEQTYSNYRRFTSESTVQVNEEFVGPP
jgi:hypothetical protein